MSSQLEGKYRLDKEPHVGGRVVQRQLREVSELPRSQVSLETTGDGPKRIHGESTTGLEGLMQEVLNSHLGDGCEQYRQPAWGIGFQEPSEAKLSPKLVQGEEEKQLGPEAS